MSPTRSAEKCWPAWEAPEDRPRRKIGTFFRETGICPEEVRMTYLRAAVLGSTLMLGSSAVCFGQPVEGSFERTLKVSGELTLEVAAGSGRIDVHTGASDTVIVQGRIRA